MTVACGRPKHPSVRPRPHPAHTNSHGPRARASSCGLPWTRVVQLATPHKGLRQERPEAPRRTRGGRPGGRASIPTVPQIAGAVVAPACAPSFLLRRSRLLGRRIGGAAFWIGGAAFWIGGTGQGVGAKRRKQSPWPSCAPAPPRHTAPTRRARSLASTSLATLTAVQEGLQCAPAHVLLDFHRRSTTARHRRSVQHGAQCAPAHVLLVFHRRSTTARHGHGPKWLPPCNASDHPRLWDFRIAIPTR